MGIAESAGELIEAPEARAKRLIESWLTEITDVVDSLHKYMADVTRDSKFMVDEFDTRVSALSLELTPLSREPVVYEFIVASTGAVGGTLLLGTRRRIPVAANVVLAIAVKMRLYENDQRILMTGTPEAPGAAAPLFLEMTGHMYPHMTP